MTQIRQVSDDHFIEDSAVLLNAMANPGRLKILEILVATEMSVGRLSELVGLSQSALSQHLAKLREVGVVSSRRNAQTIYYSCQSKAVSKILLALTELYGPLVSGPMSSATAARAAA